jgi:hypothetical protein
VSRFLVAVVACLLTLVVTPAARAHVDVLPRLLEASEETTLRVELPRLRPGPPPTELDVAGTGVRQLSSEAAGLAGVESRWRARVRVEAEPGPLTLLLRARFTDGRLVVVRHAVTVVPARSDEGSSPVLLASVAVVSVAAVTALALLFARTRRAR